jgi:hypothetical protein
MPIAGTDAAEGDVSGSYSPSKPVGVDNTEEICFGMVSRFEVSRQHFVFNVETALKHSCHVRQVFPIGIDAD